MTDTETSPNTVSARDTETLDQIGAELGKRYGTRLSLVMIERAPVHHRDSLNLCLLSVTRERRCLVTSAFIENRGPIAFATDRSSSADAIVYETPTETLSPLQILERVAIADSPAMCCSIIQCIDDAHE